MHILAIRKPTTGPELEILDRMHRVRANVFRTRLSWNVRCVDGRELNEFDKRNPTYLIAQSSRGEKADRVRLFSAIGQTMSATGFPQFLPEQDRAAHPRVVESSRFCGDTGIEEGQNHGSVHLATLTILAGIVEWWLSKGYSQFVTTTDICLERILDRVGWRLRRLSNPHLINETRSIAGSLPTDRSTFERLRPEGYQSSLDIHPAKTA